MVTQPLPIYRLGHNLVETKVPPAVISGTYGSKCAVRSRNTGPVETAPDVPGRIRSNRNKVARERRAQGDVCMHRLAMTSTWVADAAGANTHLQPATLGLKADRATQAGRL